MASPESTSSSTTRPRILVVLPRPSRFDKANDGILIGPARVLVEEALGPDFDVCYAAEFAARRSGYTHIILTGQESLDAFTHGQLLANARGFVWHLGPTKFVATFWPQDAVDHQNLESADTDEDEAASNNGKDSAKTSRANYRFWFLADCRKLMVGAPAAPDFTYALVPNLVAAAELRAAADQYIYFDIETHPPTNTLTCFSYAIGAGPVRTVLVYDYRNVAAPHVPQLMAALARAMSRNTFVIHNAAFDLLFLAVFHNIPPGPKVEDTMLMQHRFFPEAEKSLAHAISYWINAPFHKDTGGTWNPRNWAQQDRLLRYNATDVNTLRAVHVAMRRHLAECGDAGIRDSVDQVNSSIPDYLFISYAGLPINVSRLAYRRGILIRQRAQLARLVAIMAGYPLNPGSPKMLADYFVNRLGYEIVGRTDSGEPSTDETSLRRYLLKYHNPIIKVIIRYKRAQKVAGELGFQIYVHTRKR